MATRAAAGVTQTNQEIQPPSEAGRDRKEYGMPQTQPCQHLDFGLMKLISGFWISEL